ncbi:TPR-like protein, partial [Rhizophagus irregularis]
DDSDNSEADLILAKKKKSINSIIKLNSNISLSSILSRNSKKQHPTYQNIIKEINEKHYEKAESLCKEFLNFFPKSYSLRCILGYIYRCLKNYEQAHFYLKEAINLKPKEPIAYLICGEIFFWQSNYYEAINNLWKSRDYKAKINNLYIIIGNSLLLFEEYHYTTTLYNYNIALKNDPNNYLCLKNSAYCCEKYGKYSEALKVLDKLLNTNKDDSLILCYYGEILCNMEQYKAINLKPKEPIAYLICGEIFFWQSNYEEAINNLEKSIDYKVKINNLYIILGNSYLFNDCYFDACDNYNFALKNDSDNYLCLKNSAYNYAKYDFYNNALVMLDKLLNINMNDSLILCFYGEILCNMKQYSKAISYFTKANIIDPENTHNLNKRAIAYYTLQDYNKVLLDLDKVIQLDPLNNLAYYLKCLIYYTKKDIDNAIMVFKKCKELLDLNDILAKTQLFHLEYLLNKNNSTELNNILTKINQISNIKDSELLLFVRCKVYIELKMYQEAMLDLNLLCDKNNYNYSSYILYIYLLREYTDFWLYLNVNNNIDLSELGIVNGFSKHMYEKSQVYFISNLVNLNSELHQHQENDINSLSEKIISSKDKELYLNLPMLYFKRYTGIIWKINVKEILNKDCFIKFIIKSTNSEQYKNSELKHYEHVLKYEDVLKLEGLGWIEYQLPKIVEEYYVQPLIEINGSINMQMDYVRYGYNKEEITYIPNIEPQVYLISNLVNLNDKLYQFQDDDTNRNRTSVLKYLNFQLSNMELLKDVNTSFWTSDLRHRKYLGRVFIGTPVLDV